MWASNPCLHLCLVFAVIYPEAIVASFHFLVGYCAHGWAIVAVFVSGLSMHKTEAGTRQYCIARQRHDTSAVFNVPLCGKRAVVAVRTVTTVAPRCTAAQDRYPPVVTVPWPKAISFEVLDLFFFPDLYLYFPTCSLSQAQS